MKAGIASDPANQSCVFGQVLEDRTISVAPVDTDTEGPASLSVYRELVFQVFDPLDTLLRQGAFAGFAAVLGVLLRRCGFLGSWHGGSVNEIYGDGTTRRVVPTGRKDG